MGMILLGLNVVSSLAEALLPLIRRLVDVREAVKETARVGKKHVNKALVAGKEKYRKGRERHERAKRRDH